MCLRVCRRHSWEICSLRGATSVPGTAARRQAPTRGPCRNLKRKTPMHRHKSHKRHRHSNPSTCPQGQKVRVVGPVNVNNEVTVSNTYVQQIGYTERSGGGHRGGHRKGRSGRSRNGGHDWGPTLACLGLVDNGRYSDEELMVGSYKTAAYGAKSLAQSTSRFVGGCCTIISGIGEGIASLFR